MAVEEFERKDSNDDDDDSDVSYNFIMKHEG